MDTVLRRVDGPPSRDEFWQERSIEDRHDQVRVPALNIAGWYDIFLDGSLRNFTGVRESGATEAAREGSRLLLGPWTHTTPPLSGAGSVDFGAMGGQSLMPLSLDVDGETLRFFDYWLKGMDDGLSAEPPVRLFVMGEDVWRSENEWPLARAVETEFSSAAAVTPTRSRATARSRMKRRVTTGRMSSSTTPSIRCRPSAGNSAATRRRWTPAPSTSARSKRDPTSSSTTPPLEKDTEVTGPVHLHLWAATSAPDTDFTGKLVDIYPDGYARNLTDGIIRARYRGDRRSPADHARSGLQYEINLWATSNLFRRGHRIGLEVSSSNFPRFDRNLNTGHELGADAEMLPAMQTIFHDREHPSRLVLPIVPRKQ